MPGRTRTAFGCLLGLMGLCVAGAPAPSAGAEPALGELIERVRAGDTGKRQPLRTALHAELARIKAAEGTARDRELDEVIAGLRALIDGGANATAPKRMMQCYRDRFALGDAIGLVKSAPYARRMLILLGTEGDARRLRDLSAEALAMLNALEGDLSDRLDDIGQDLEMLALGIPPQLRDLRDRVRYKSAWAGLHLATAAGALPVEAPADAEGARRRRRNLLTEARRAVVHLAQGDPSSGVKYRSLLLCGMAGRQLAALGVENDRQAETFLTAAIDQRAEPDVQMQGIVELAGLAVQRGRWQQALHWQATLRQRGQALAGADGLVAVELQCAAVGHHLYARQAEAADQKDSARAEMLARRAQQEFADLLGRHPDRLDALAPLIGRRYGDVEDLSRLAGPIVYAKAAAAEEADTAEATRCLQEMLRRTDAPSKALHPAAMWHLARALYRQGRAEGPTGWPNRKASARWFMRLADEFPGDARAAAAARNAAEIRHSRIRALVEAEQAVPVQLRRALIGSLEALWGNWPGSPEARDRPLAYVLARQYEALGQWAEAVVWCRRVDGDSADHLPAWYNAIVLDIRLLRHVTDADVRATRATGLIDELRRLADSALGLSQSTEDSDDRALTLELGAEADYQIAELLNRELGRPGEAARHAEGLHRRWPGQNRVVQRGQALRVAVLLAQGKTQPAMAALRAMKPDNDRAIRDLAGRVAMRIRDRLDAEEEPAEEIDRWRQAYREFAEQACSAGAPGPQEGRYVHRQMLGEAWMETGKSADALAIFRALAQSRPDDVRNLQGMARCHWVDRSYGSAVALYQQALDGLDRRTLPDPWWRTQLMLARCLLEATRGDTVQRKRLSVRLKQLRLQDSSFGGYAGRFERLQGRIQSDTDRAAER